MSKDDKYMVSEMNEDIKSINRLVDIEIGKISNPKVRNALGRMIVSPIQHLRKWDYGNGESFVCWTIAIDKNSDTLFVYSDEGFGPQTPWGLVSESDLSFGMDTGWFISLKDCFLDSKIANELPIWVIERQIQLADKKIIAIDLTLKDAFEKRDQLTISNPGAIFTVLPSN